MKLVDRIITKLQGKIYTLECEERYRKHKQSQKRIFSPEDVPPFLPELDLEGLWDPIITPEPMVHIIDKMQYHEESSLYND